MRDERAQVVGEPRGGGAGWLPTGVGIGGDGELFGEGGAVFGATLGQGAGGSGLSAGVTRPTLAGPRTIGIGAQN